MDKGAGPVPNLWQRCLWCTLLTIMSAKNVFWKSSQVDEIFVNCKEPFTFKVKRRIHFASLILVFFTFNLKQNSVRLYLKDNVFPYLREIVIEKYSGILKVVKWWASVYCILLHYSIVRRAGCFRCFTVHLFLEDLICHFSVIYAVLECEILWLCHF